MPSVSAPDCAIAIIGAGVVGCAIAWSLAERGCGPIYVLEAEAGEGRGISSRNSQVVHAGLYYPPGSRKALSCVEGMRALWRWVAERGVAHRRTGKLVVATRPELEGQLEVLADNAGRSGAVVEAISLARARELEPHLPSTITAALWSPWSGIVDAHGLVRSLIVAAEGTGRAELLCSTRVDAVEAVRGGFRLQTSRGPLVAERLINAAGFGAPAVARELGIERTLYPARGDYFRLRRHPAWGRLIYPVKEPGSPSLGVHLTLELDGRCRLGPDLEWLDPDAPIDYDPARGEAKAAAFLGAARRLLGPEHVDDDALVYDGCGVRPKLVGPGEPLADFEILESPAGAWHLLGIESPGLTAALALAREVGEVVSPGARGPSAR